MSSIRRRLLLWLLAGVSFAMIAGAISTYLLAREEANDLADYQLQQMALSFRDHALASGLIPLEPDPDHGLEVMVQIWNQQGVRLYISNPRVGVPERAQLGFADVSARDDRWRVFSVQLRDHVIQVAQPYEVRRRLAASLALRTVWPLFAVVPLLGLLIWLIVGRGFAPLVRLAREVRQRTPEAMTPIPERDLPDELRPMVHALNALLGRLGGALDAQRAFVADAAHELRTPLTALRLQAQLAERATDDSERRETLARLKLGVGRAAHLVQQLLTLAREEGPSTEVLDTRVRLDEVARDVVAELAPLAHAKGVDLGIARSETLTVSGRAHALRTLLSNLVDNAVRYTPPAGSVDVVLHREGEHALIEVSDTGPGIPHDERDRVFDRFYRRAGANAEGSGLGLAIVRHIVERHNGSVALSGAAPSGGLRVVVRLPLVRAAQG